MSVVIGNRSEAARRDGRQRLTWNRLLWALIYPRKKQRIVPTLSGVLLIGLSFGIGAAAYNAANNILFITLSLLLACLILSGVLSWLNFRSLSWQLDVVPPLRAGQEAVIGVRLRNHKSMVPTYGLWFELTARVVESGADATAQTTFAARSGEVRAALARADEVEARGRLFLPMRLDPGGEARLEWIFTPARRGGLRIEMEHTGSLFPFGFLRKQIAAELTEDVIVWPAAVEYRRLGAASAKRTTGGERAPRAGTGSDLFALRRYQTGDSHRLIHWKASARTRQLLVRQYAAETTDGYALWLRTDASVWARAEQFELAISLAATLAEDFFRMEKLSNAALDGDAPVPIRRGRDLEGFLDRLALTKRLPVANAGLGALPPRRKNLITLGPDGPRGVAAYVEGQKIATV